MSLHLSKYSYKITVDSLKILPKLPQNVNVFVKSLFCTKSFPIMLALCLMLLSSYYAQTYAGIIRIIGSSLIQSWLSLYENKSVGQGYELCMLLSVRSVAINMKSLDEIISIATSNKAIASI